MNGGRIELVRLTEVSLDDVHALLTEPRLRRHMPLSTDVSREGAAAWVRGKDTQWQTNGYGPRAVLLDGGFAGWAGFQAEPGGADLAVVLLPGHWGSGHPEHVVARLGFIPDGEVAYGGSQGVQQFRQFWLTRAAWLAATA